MAQHVNIQIHIQEVTEAIPSRPGYKEEGTPAKVREQSFKVVADNLESAKIKIVNILGAI